MNETHGSSTAELLLSVRLDENRLFNRSSNTVLEIKDKLQKTPKSVSALYRQPRLPPGRASAQRVNFRLAPLLNVEECETTLQISDANAWTVIRCPGKTRLPGFPERTSTRQTWLRMMSLWDRGGKDQDKVSEISPSPTPTTESPTTDSYPTSDSCTPFPVFRRRMPTETFLIRRPTIEKPIPLRADEDIFDLFVKSVELKALPFQKTADSYKFYETNFPLLLTKITKEGERCTTPSRRSRTPESPMTVMINRKRAINQRIIELEFMMDVMEKQTEDCRFVTELHSPVFDPTTWPWNKVDVNCLRRRYTIDASLRES